MTFDNANRKNIREAEKSARLAEANRVAYTRTIMSTSFGREWIHNLLVQCKIFHTPFVAGALDLTSFNCGMQNIGLALFGDIAAHCPHEYSLMMTEASTKDEANGRRYESGNDSVGGASSTGPRRNPAQPSNNYAVDADGWVHDASGGSETGDEAGLVPAET